MKSLLFISFFLFLGLNGFGQEIKGDSATYILKQGTDYIDFNNPNDVKSSKHEAIGLEYFINGYYKEAIAQFDTAILYRPNAVNAYLNRGSVYYEIASTSNIPVKYEKTYQKALNDFDRVILLSPLLAKGYYSRGLVYKDQGLYTQAVGDFNAAILKGIDIPDIYTYLGVCLCRLSQFSEAETAFSKAISLDSTNAEFYFNRSVLYAMLEKTKLEIADLISVISLNKDYPAANYNLGYVYMNKYYDYSKAIEYYDKELSINSGDPKPRFQRAKCYLRLQQCDSALNDLNYLIERMPNDKILYEMRILSYECLGQNVQAEIDRKFIEKLK